MLLSISSSRFLILIYRPLPISFFFFFNDTATTEIYTLSLHDALPISLQYVAGGEDHQDRGHDVDRLPVCDPHRAHGLGDRKSTRLNSSHQIISYAVFCLKKKKKIHNITTNNLITAL